MKISKILFITILAGVILTTPSLALAQGLPKLQPRKSAFAKTTSQSVPGQVIVKFKDKPVISYESEISMTVPFVNRKVTFREAGYSFRGLSGVTKLNKELKVTSAKVLGTTGAVQNMTALELPPTVNRDEAIEKYRREAGVEYAEPNYVVRSLWTPNDPYFTRNSTQDYQWNLRTINMPAAWDISQGGSSSVKVAVIDSGAAFEDYGDYKKAPELAGVNFVAPKSFKSFSDFDSSCLMIPATQVVTDHPNDYDNGHGTHVTGTIAQATNNATHSAGMAFNVSVIPIKSLYKDGDCEGGTNVDIISGINHAVANGAKVINMSLGGPVDSQALHDAVVGAVNAGVTVVVATGNSATRVSSPGVAYPGAYPEVISVGATRFDNKRSDYSQYGETIAGTKKPDIVAPGGQLWLDDPGATCTDQLSCYFLDQNNDLNPDGIVQQTISVVDPNVNHSPPDPTKFTAVDAVGDYGMSCFATDGTYIWVSEACGNYNGTSMATPHVTAAAALILSVNPSLTPTEIKSILTATANKTLIPSYNVNEYGAGLLDVAAALASAASGLTPTVTPSPTPTPGGPSVTPSPTPTDGPSPTPIPTIPAGSPTPPDWSQTEEEQLIVGDVNDDNKISIEDVVAVLSKYTDFSVPAAAGTPEDVNNDQAITIEDVSLVLMNYSDFEVPGEE